MTTGSAERSTARVAVIARSQASSTPMRDRPLFRAAGIAREVGAAGGTAPAAYNAANEIAVDAFHDGRVGFLDIVGTVERVVGDHARVAGRFDATSVEGVLSADAWARDRARELLGLGAHPGTGAMI